MSFLSRVLPGSGTPMPWRYRAGVARPASPDCVIAEAYKAPYFYAPFRLKQLLSFNFTLLMLLFTRLPARYFLFLLSGLLAVWGPAALAQTLPVTTGLRMHLRADDLALTNGQAVTAWDDQTANNNTPTTGSGTAPTFRTNQANGHAVVRFAGGNLVSPAINLTGTSALDLFIVARTGAGSGSQVVVETGPDFNASNSDIVIAERDDTCPNCAGGLSANLKGDAGYNQTTTAATLIGSFGAAQATFDKTLTTREAQLRVNGALVPAVSGTFDFNNTNAFGNSPFFVGGRGSGPIAPYFGDIAEVIFYSRKLTSAERTQVQAYLTARYALQFQDVPVTSGLRLHLKADAGVTTSGGTVSAWADQSGNGFNVAATGSQQPALTASAINGQPALTLDGNDDFLQSTAARDLLGGQQNYTFYAVTRPAATQKSFADIFDYSHSGFFNFVIQQDGGSTNTFYNNGLANQTLTAGTPSIYGGTFVNGGTLTGTSRLNGGNAQAQSVGGPVNFGVPNNFRVGNWINGGREFNGQIAEVLIFNRVLTGAEQQQVEAYLSARYAITLATAPFGNVVQLNGTTDLVTSVGPAFTQTDNFTLEAWVKPAALPTSAFQVIISNGNDGTTGSGSGMALGIGSGTSAGGGSKLSVLFNGVQFFDPGLTLPTANQWYHVAVTRRAGTTFAYLDGVQGAGTTTVTPNAILASGGSALRVGSHRGVSQFNGQIDEARAWTVGRTQAEIQSTMGGEVNANTVGLAANWRFNRTGQGAGLVIQSHVTANPSLTGTTVGTATTPVFTGTQVDNAVLLNGTTDGIQIPTNAALTFGAASSFTIESLVKTTTTTAPAGEPKIFSQQRCTAGVVILSVSADGIVHFRVGDVNNNEVIVDGPIINDGLWHQVAGVRDVAADQIRLFVDGVLVAQATDPTTGAITAASTENWLGQRFPCANKDFFTGSLDEFRIWNVARTQGQIQNRMNQTLGGNETGLALYYDMNRSGQGAGLTVSNGAGATGIALDGTTLGTASTPVFSLANNPGVVAAAPTISSFTPTSGPVGTVVTVNGNNFAGATSGSFNGTITTIGTVVSATQAQMQVPAGATTGTISVTTPRGTGTSTGIFTVTTAGPTDLTFFPTSGSPGSVVLVTKTSGADFTTATSARFNGRAATGTTFNTATQVTATVPSGATTGPLTAVTGGTTLTGGTFTVTAALAPVLQNFTPVRAPVGTVIALVGGNFNGVTGVRFGNTNAPVFSVQSVNAIFVAVPAGAQTGDRIYVLAAGGMAQSMRPFTLISPPTLTATFPSFGTAQALVQLTGTNLTNATSVSFNGTDATAFTVHSATSITATIPVGATTGPIAVTTVAGTATTASSFTVNTAPAAPSISGFTPGSGPVGTAVTVVGTSLTGATLVRFGALAGTALTPLSATQVRASVPAGATTAPIWVLTPGGLAQSATRFSVAAPGAPVPAPTLTSFDPASGSPGAMVILSGTNLSGATAVRFGGNVPAAGFTVSSATEIIATIPAGAVTGAISVTTPGGAASTPTAFTITSTPAPTITGFTPTSGPVGQVVTLTGTNFGGFLKIKLTDILVSSVTSVTPTSLTFSIPTGARSGRFRVFAGGGMQQALVAFTVIPAPTVTSFSPASGSPGSQVTLTGTNLTGATAVTFGGVNAPAFVVNSATSLTVTVPAGAATGVLGVTTPGGTGASTGTFTVTVPPAPTISGLNPASGIVGAVVQISGTNLLGTTSVRVNGKAVETFVIFSATLVLAQIPDGATTGPISLSTSGGQAVSPTDYTILTPPDIDALTPIRGPVGTVVTLVGEGFTGATALTVGGVSAVVFTVVNDKKLTATVPTGALSGQLALTTPVAVAISAQPFTVTGMRVDSAHVTAASAARLGLYPNPASGTVTVYLQDWQTGGAIPAVELYDALGRRIRRVVFPDRVTTATAPIELLGVPAGVYIVRCGPLAQRLVVE